MALLKKTTRSVALRIVLSVVTGCTGTAGPGGGGDSPRPSTAEDVGSVAIHRLNNLEYNNTVRDLLGTTTRPADNFDPDLGANGFNNNAAALVMTSQKFSGYVQAAEALSLEALTVGSPVYAKLSACPAATDGVGCAKTNLRPFVTRAWRRPVTEEELSKLSQLVQVAAQEGEDFTRGMQLAVKAVLLSPNFLYRIEADPNPSSQDPQALDSYELASRLSYFLWNSMPDEELLAAAENGGLRDTQTLAAQARRMLMDVRARSFMTDFVSQWLQTRKLDDASHGPNRTVFPAFDTALREAMQDEAEMLFATYVREGRNALNLLSPGTVFVNDRLGEFYGIPNVTGGDLREVASGSSGRGGLITLGAVLTVTSMPERTSTTLRGQFVLAQLLCSPPSSPPPNVPQLSLSGTGGTLRQQLEAHRSNPACAGCHSQMDPLGFGLEHFDGIGAWRDMEGQYPVDATGTMPDGTPFDGAAALQKILRADPRFPACLARQLFTYALGREPLSSEQETGHLLARLSKDFESKGFSIPEVVSSIVTSDAFRFRRGNDFGVTP